MPAPRKALLIYPRHLDSFALQPDQLCGVLAAKSGIFPLGLITVAALLPSSWDLRLIDGNAETLSERDFEGVDLIFTGGMSAHRTGVKNILDLARSLKVKTVVGGPDATEFPSLYEAADHLVLGEAEITLPAFLSDLENGRPNPCYPAPGPKADITRSPVPRYDLINFNHYIKASIQVTRGCPFLCEFCSVIERTGRIPRIKNPEQVVSELQAIYDLGYRGPVKCADDNLIGNTKLIRNVLAAVRDWQREHDYPFSLYSMMSFNVVDDEEILSFLRDAGFSSIYIGIESPSEGVIKSMRKIQNKGRRILESVRKVNQFGISLDAGFILGNDGETAETTEAIASILEEGSFSNVDIQLLQAEPNSALFRRMIAEGRLITDIGKVAETDRETLLGLNFVTERSRVEILTDYIRLKKISLSPRYFFKRLRNQLMALDRSAPARRNHSGKRGQTDRRKKLAKLISFLKALCRKPQVFFHFSYTVIFCLFRKPDSLDIVLNKTIPMLDAASEAHWSIQYAKRVIKSLEHADRSNPLALTKQDIVGSVSVSSSFSR